MAKQLIHIGFLLALMISFSFSAQAQNISTVSLKDANGMDVSFQAYQNKKAVVVIFTSMRCVYAKKYEDRLKMMHQQYASQGVQFVAINSNDASVSEEEGQPHIRKAAPYPFPYLKDEDQSVARQFGAEKTPEAFLLVPQSGGFKVVYKGKIDDNPLAADLVKETYLLNAIQQVLAGGTPAISDTSPGGCNITWSRE